MKKLIYLSITLLLVSCHSVDKKNQEQEQLLEKEVLNIHDEVMPLTELLEVKQNQIKKITSSLDSIIKAKPKTDTIQISKQATQIIQDITIANDAMMNWMHEFSADYTNKKHTEIIQYLNKEKLNLTKIRTQVKKAQQNADKFISALN